MYSAPGNPQLCHASTVRTIVISHSSGSIHEVREAAALDLCRGRDALAVSAELVDDVVLVISELASNALRHASALPTGGTRVTWSVTPTAVLVSVTDGGGSTRPHVARASSSGTGGRGLSIVRTLASDWGVAEAGGEVTVWAAVDRRAGGAAGAPASPKSSQQAWAHVIDLSQRTTSGTPLARGA